VKSKKLRDLSILETGGYVMTELRRTNRLVGMLRTERLFTELRSDEFFPVAIPGVDASRKLEAPPL
jgi:hypothetical protein